MVAKQRLHVPGVVEVAVFVGCEQAARGVERGVVAQAGEDVRNDALVRVSVQHAARREQRQMLAGGQGGQHLDDSFLAAYPMALNFHLQAVRAENTLERNEDALDLARAAALPSAPQRAVLVASQRDQPLAVARYLLPCSEAAAFALRGI